ncbi:MAG TPA: hypothetical protein ENH80_14740 [Phycisphaerae bacterium]|nr:hypothetical protein [Phycisphaerae bacterium]HDZ45187.1 hypothetical protein [Phycisphaerae bacterium]
MSFQQISDLPCIALLGEPGIGKSTAMVDERKATERLVAASSDEIQWLNLNEYGDESRLIADLFECDRYVRWVAGNHVLHVFLDSLDECRIRIPQVATILASHFERIPDKLPRLRLRIACRTADWPVVLEDSLPHFWAEGAFGALELAPLRRQDVRVAAEAEGVDPDHFFEEMDRSESVPLGIKPVTLKFLLSVFKERGKLPNTRLELYEEGCKRLCKELNQFRQDLRDVGGAGKLSAEQRLTVASRIAAISIFCRKPTVATNPEATGLVDEVVDLSLLAGGTEEVGRNEFVVSEGHIREVLGTGLFSARGPQRTGFSHQTYAEYLASRYLVLHQVPPEGILSLIQHPGHPDRAIIPQLYEVSAWLAGRDKVILRGIAQTDPQVLLRGDAGSLSGEDRRMIVDVFLEALDSRRVSDREWSLESHYKKLAHPDLSEQLGPWIRDKDKHVVAREAAIDIARCCGLDALQSDLADVALDQNERERLRDSAIRALVKTGGAETRGRLRPLAFGEAGDDPRDQLKGNALRALWPDLVTTEEVFRNLTPRGQRNFTGAYVVFVEYELLPHIDTGDLPAALEWARSQATTRDTDFHFARVADDIMVRSWRHLDDSSVLQAMAATCVERIANHRDLIWDPAKRDEHSAEFEDPCKRRQLVEAVIERLTNDENVVVLTHLWPRLVRDSDFDWCTQKLLLSVSGPCEVRWAKLVWSLSCWGDASSGRLDTICNAREKSAALTSESELFFTPVQLDSDRAHRLKEMTGQEAEQEEKPEVLEWLPKDRIQHFLTVFEAGETMAMADVLRQMTLEDTSTHYDNLFELDITTLPGWRKADEETQARILKAAESYLASCAEFDVDRLCDRSASQIDAASYKAFLLLKKLRPEGLDSFPDEVWAHWTPVFFGPFGVGEMEDERKAFVTQAYERVPDVVITVIERIVHRQITNGDCRSIPEEMEHLWDNRVADTAFGLLPSAEPSPSCWSLLLAALIGHADPRGMAEASGRLSLPLPDGNSNRQLALRAAVVLINCTDDCSWSEIWPIIQAEREFGRQVIMEAAHNTHHHAAEIACKLNEEQQAHLFIWLTCEFPYEQDPEHDGVFSPTREDAARELRDAVVGLLEHKGTPASCQALERIAGELPELDWLRTVLIEARKNTLRKTWRPLSAEEFLEVVAQPNKGLVRTEKELQEVLVGTLSQLESKFQGETPATPDLWDQVDRTKGQERNQPKDEGHLADWVKRNLEPELGPRAIAVAREVEIRRGEGTGIGEDTDILVTASVPGLTGGELQQAKVIIEAKGCWNPDLKTAMKDQLVDRYLAENQCTHGIYLVGWYVCDQWDDGDYRKARTPKWSLDEARGYFERQAESLSTGGISVRAVVLNTGLR